MPDDNTSQAATANSGYGLGATTTGTGSGEGGATVTTIPPVDTKAIASAARKEASDKIAADLGCTPQEAKQILDQVRAAADAQKSDTQKALDAATAARADADRARAEALADRLAIKVERKLLAAGVPDTALARASRMVTLDGDADDTQITAEVEALKAELPALFSGTATVPVPPPAPGRATPPTNQATGFQGKSMEDIGRETAARLGIKVRPVNAA